MIRISISFGFMFRFMSMRIFIFRFRFSFKLRMFEIAYRSTCQCLFSDPGLPTEIYCSARLKVVLSIHFVRSLVLLHVLFYVASDLNTTYDILNPSLPC